MMGMNHCMCGCGGVGAHFGPGFFMSKKDKLEMLKDFKEVLKKKIEHVDNMMKELKEK